MMDETKLLNRKLKNAKRQRKRIEYDLTFLLNIFLDPLKDGDPSAEGMFEGHLELLFPILSDHDWNRFLEVLIKYGYEYEAVFMVDYFLDAQGAGNRVEETEFRKSFQGLTTIILHNSDQVLEAYIRLVKFYHSHPQYRESLSIVLSKYHEPLLKNMIEELDSKTILSFLSNILLEDMQLAFRFSQYFDNHWFTLPQGFFTPDREDAWLFFAQILKHDGLVKKLKKIQADRELKEQGGPEIDFNKFKPKDLPSSSGDFASDWKEESDLSKYGYIQVSKKTDREREAILDQAMKHLPIASIISFIESRLTLSHRQNENVSKDYSKTIRAYEVDLYYIQRIYQNYRGSIN